MEEPSDLALYIHYDSASTTNGSRELAGEVRSGTPCQRESNATGWTPPPTAVTTRKLIFFEHH